MPWHNPFFNCFNSDNTAHISARSVSKRPVDMYVRVHLPRSSIVFEFRRKIKCSQWSECGHLQMGPIIVVFFFFVRSGSTSDDIKGNDRYCVIMFVMPCREPISDAWNFLKRLFCRIYMLPLLWICTNRVVELERLGLPISSIISLKNVVFSGVFK